MDRAERDKLPVAEARYPCSRCGAEHRPGHLEWCSGWHCGDCWTADMAPGPNLADVLAERHHNTYPANPCGARSRHHRVADGSEPLECNLPADHGRGGHAHYDHQTGRPIAGWVR